MYLRSSSPALLRTIATSAMGMLAVVCVLAQAEPVWAGEESNLPTWVDLNGPPDPSDRVIQRRKYELDQEIALFVGVLPANPFYKGLALTAGYTLHFSNYVGWEILSATYSLDFDTSLKQQLLLILNANDTPPPNLPEVTWMVASHLVIKPFYGKQSFLDLGLAHLEAAITIGPAFLGISGLAGNGFAPGLDWGIGLRLWLTSVVSARLQLGDAIFFFQGVNQALHIDGGISFNLGGDE